MFYTYYLEVQLQLPSHAVPLIVGLIESVAALAPKTQRCHCFGPALSVFFLLIFLGVGESNLDRFLQWELGKTIEPRLGFALLPYSLLSVNWVRDSYRRRVKMGLVYVIFSPISIFLDYIDLSWKLTYVLMIQMLTSDYFIKRAIRQNGCNRWSLHV